MRQNDPDFEKNLRRFYEGAFLISGWNDRVSKLLSSFSQSERKELEPRLEQLGEKVGHAWAAKDGPVKTADLQTWGGELKQGQKGGFDSLMDALDEVEKKVDERLEA